MGKYQAYSEYKDSGVEWLGHIPEQWIVCALDKMIDPIRRITYGIVQPGEPDPNGRYMIRGQDYSTGWSEGNTIFKVSDKVEVPYKRARLKTGDIVLTIVGAGVGNTEVVPEWLNGSNITQTTARLAPNGRKSSGRFIRYLFTSPAGKANVDRYAKGAAQPGLNLADVAKYYFCFPSLEEQQKIATLIEKQQQLIALLKEKRQAVISHAVTKGLNPNAPMKNSGVEWLGDVPEHWGVSQLKYKVKTGTSITYGIVQAGPHVEDGIPYIKTSDMSGDVLPIDGYSKTSKFIDDSFKRSKVYEGDLVIGIRASVGKCLPVPKEISGANLTQGTAKISPSDELERDFLLSYLCSSQVQVHLNTIAKGATFKEITLDMLRRVAVVVPPINEQHVIKEKVADLNSHFNRLVGASEKQMALLSERRTALISAAVTGKIDVRNWKAPEQSEKIPEAS
jgi:type I restriction enzyme S subunit